MAKILVVDDQPNMRTTLVMMLRGAGYDVDAAVDGTKGSELGATGAYDVVLTDLRMGAVGGIEVLRNIKQKMPMTEVVVMTAYGTIESAVEAMRLGAFDYIQKPFAEQELLMKVQRALDNRRLAGQVQLFANEFKERYHFENIIGRSQSIRDVLARIVKIAPSDATVLITGESGTGKELVAKAIHANSRRNTKPFVPVNCAAITETLLESELFGHARGAFTGAVGARKGLMEEADGGTFFFDEIAETPMSFQAKLLRAIQENEIRRVGENKPIKVDVRIIAATNQDLLRAIEDKTFRQDLYYRLNVARFELPPLRERREDIPLLADFFLQKYNRKNGVKARLGEGVVEALMQHDFPGNIRELENLLEQGVALSGGGIVGLDEVEMRVTRSSSTSGRTLAEVVDSAEKQAIEDALRECDGSRERAAELLAISPTTLWRKMTRLGVVYDSRS
ncbi:MAG TPA: sigma-54 dependent transcriptional regulator [Polyangiaceae bacterium]|jgi:two-component system response regulator HydG|nr:MAG: Transcriptional regulatory protein ZraR [Deltaproteobacteria bacterium ADurb.Bin207]HNS99957.1 sigma-54 dependent transcriptional regulator [Polyangiaceae bacterium]HNZ23894.1 sigma-54 dependent transcriptional regulator [Polyangiaceae bacterium]HOD22959.1 sigma-54 dependent transcriptional regulator [Polyangiaceae bacterium]HOE49736.1 sigma-54 dependent transcriptional regulator [Polyangiaceae bacterium]